jgi:oligopeptide transport system permease protein
MSPPETPKADPSLPPWGRAGAGALPLPPPPPIQSEAWQRFWALRVNRASLAVVLVFAMLTLASVLGLVARDWQRDVGVPNAPPTLLGPPVERAATVLPKPSGPNLDLSAVDPLAPVYAEWARRAAAIQTHLPSLADTLPWGGDRLGRDVRAKAIKGAEVSISVGVLAALLATLIGTLLGACAGFAGGRVDDALEWLYNVFTSIPGILLVFTFAALLGHHGSPIPKGVGSLVLILGGVGWPGIYRLVRAEFMKHVGRDYVRAAEAMGAGPATRMFRHILPNVAHVVLVQLSVHVVGFIKAEVILSYLGLGVGVDQVSWGSMLAESQSELILGHWWQLAAATSLMALFVTAFSFLTDGLRDALDPKLRGLP